MNAVSVTKGQIRREVALYRKVQRFWNKSTGEPGAVATINGLTFTRFMASRHLNLNGKAVARYLEGQAEEKAGALRRKPALAEGILQ